MTVLYGRRYERVLSIGDIMRREIAVVRTDTPAVRAVEVMMDGDLEGALVVDVRGRVVGSIGDEQLVAALRQDGDGPWWRTLKADREEAATDQRLGSTTAGDLMLRRVVTAPPSAPVTSAIRNFDHWAVNVIAVVDRGRLIGAVFRRDVVRHVLLPR